MAEQEMTSTGPAHKAGQLSVVSTSTGGIRVVSLAGEIDYDTGEALRRALDIVDTPRPRLVVDLRQVTFLDSTGLNILITARRDLGEAGGWLRLAAANETVMRTLRIVGIDSVIDCHETLRQALAD
ncbi:STAS domain-containing protein [Streptomyces sp. NPDC048416]|uniref:STAS domain-containing protein n=1 Tax=Streptomyces sp. NPDC048416 TaxID=3365546 RepID=UPI00371893E7